ncbi:hypothetical protein GCM10007981_10890 [Thermocladium modestius]|uniref:Uncharacterized protein n=1 Tax=Thermocladium modestius TaxID=62609 RepID=A0A830GW78_9CREN|nr:adenosylcobinamide amidohydrolase [Thermocladium modestius]GGP20910.1 hypothetical protein GCM10007981_10890 [Thermocladium modestius]
MIRGAPGLVTVDFGGELTSLSTTVRGGGMSAARGAIFKTVPRDFDGDPDEEAASALSMAGVSGQWLVFLTAVDVGLASIVDWGRGFAVSTAGLEPPACLHTINVLAVSREPLNQEGLVDLFKTAVEAKSLAAIKLGLMCGDDVAVGTVSDAVAVAAPLAGEGARFAGPGTSIGGAAARGVVEAVLTAAFKWLSASGGSSGFLDDESTRRYLELIRHGLAETRSRYSSYSSPS